MNGKVEGGRGYSDGARGEECADAFAEVEDEEVGGFPGREDGGAVVALDLERSG